MGTTYTLGSVAPVAEFEVLYKSIRRSKSSDVFVQHIPYSSNNYIMLNGAAETRLMAQIFVTCASYAQLEARVGATHYLIGPDGIENNAILVDLQRTDLYSGSKIIADATFILQDKVYP
jgi:hypothetical protein